MRERLTLSNDYSPSFQGQKTEGEGKRQNKLLSNLHSRCVHRRKESRIKTNNIWRLRKIKYKELDSGDVDVGLGEEFKKREVIMRSLV